MNRRRQLLSTLMVAAAVIATTVAVPAPASAATDTSVLAMSGDSTDYLTQGGSYLYSAPAATFSTTGGIAGVGLEVQQDSHWWYLNFAAPTGGTLTAGTTYTGAAGSPSDVVPGLFIYGDGRSCSVIAGSFTVHEVETDGTGAITRFAASFDQQCDGNGHARGQILFHSTLPFAVGASLGLTGPTTVPVGQPVRLHGTLADGTHPVAAATVSFSRTDGSGTTMLPDATTAADGTYSVVDSMPATDATYTASFAGNADLQPLQATWKVKQAKYVSAVTVLAPTSATRAKAYTLSGKLTSGGAVVPGTHVSVRRTDLAGARILSLLTNAAGVYSYRDVPAVGGTVTWAVTWPGNVSRTAATASRKVAVSRSATALSIKASSSVYLYGAKAVVTVHLGKTFNGRSVTVYARPWGTSVSAPGTRIASGRLSTTGSLVARYTMTRRTTFTAVFAGDYRYNRAAKAVSPYSRARVGIALAGYSGRSGSTYLYTTNDVGQVITVAPNHAGECYSTVVQAFQGGGWQLVASLGCGSLDSTSHGYAIFSSNHAKGILVRIHASVGSNSVSLGSTSAWIYCKYV